MVRTYGEYRWNVRFQQGMKRIRDGITNHFEITTEDAIHRFKKMEENIVERKSHYYGDRAYGEPIDCYAYYNIKGRRICPIHLKLLEREWVGSTLGERWCPVEGCKYRVERYCITDLEQKPITDLNPTHGAN